MEFALVMDRTYCAVIYYLCNNVIFTTLQQKLVHICVCVTVLYTELVHKMHTWSLFGEKVYETGRAIAQMIDYRGCKRQKTNPKIHYTKTTKIVMCASSISIH